MQRLKGLNTSRFDWPAAKCWALFQNQVQERDFELYSNTEISEILHRVIRSIYNILYIYIHMS